MQTKFLAVSISMVAILSAGCDPEAPVESSDVDAEIQAAITVHGDDTTTHGNLIIPAANISGEIDSDQIAAGAVGNSELDVNSVGSEEIADGTIAIGDMGAGSVGTTQLADLSVSAAKIQAGSIDATKLAPNSIVGGLQGVIMDGSITAFDLGNASVGTLAIMDNSVTSDDIAANTIQDVDIAANTITAGSIANDAIGAGELANNAVDTAAIANLAVDDTKLAANAVITAKIADANVTAGKLASLSVTQAKLNSDWAGERQDAATGAFTDAFVFNQPAGGSPIDITIWGACESDVAGSQVRIRDMDNNVDAFACPDTNLNGPPDLFLITLANVANAKTVSFQFDAGANDGIVRWRIYGISLSGDP